MSAENINLAISMLFWFGLVITYLFLLYSNKYQNKNQDYQMTELLIDNENENLQKK